MREIEWNGEFIENWYCEYHKKEGEEIERRMKLK